MGHRVGIEHTLDYEVVNLGKTLRVNVLVELHAYLVAFAQHAVRRLRQMDRRGEGNVLDDLDSLALAKHRLCSDGAVGNGAELIFSIRIDNCIAHVDERVDAVLNQRTLSRACRCALYPAVYGGPVGSPHLALLHADGIQDAAVAVIARSGKHQSTVGSSIDKRLGGSKGDRFCLRLEVSRQPDVVAHANLSRRIEHDVETVDVDDVVRGRFNLERHHSAVARSQGDVVVVGVRSTIDGYLGHLSPLVVIDPQFEVYSTRQAGQCGVGELELEYCRFAGRHTCEHRLVAVDVRCLNLHCGVRDNAPSGVVVLGTLLILIVAACLTIHLAGDKTVVF